MSGCCWRRGSSQATAAALDELHYQPGQALVLRVPLPEGGTDRRDDTIRWLDPAAQRLAIDFVQHGVLQPSSCDAVG